MQRFKAYQRVGNPPKAARGSPGEVRGGWDRSVRPKGAKGDSPGQSEAPPWVRFALRKTQSGRCVLALLCQPSGLGTAKESPFMKWFSGLEGRHTLCRGPKAPVLCVLGHH
jgi:hypothetical protein